MRVVICGANGALGKLICGIFGDEVVGKVSIDGENNVPRTFGELGEVKADVVVDFSHHTAVGDVLAYAKQIGAAAVIGTTGHTAEEKEMIYIISSVKAKKPIMRSIMQNAGIESKAHAVVFSLPVTDTAGFRLFGEKSE